MRVIEAIERRPFSLPIREVLNEEGDLTFLQNIKDKGYFHVDLQSGKLTLVAGNHIGHIPLTSEIVVRVAPKVPVGNMARIISIGNQPIKCLDYFKRTYKVQGYASNTLLEAIARSLLASLKELDVEGIYQEFSQFSERLTGLRGRINMSQYVKDCGSKANSTKLPCTYYELTTDTLLNRTIKKAIHKIGYALSLQSRVDKKVLADLNYFANLFGNVKEDNNSNLATQVREYLLHVRLPVLRHYYLDIIDTSLIILEGSGLELQQISNSNQMFSFIVNLESAFENYVREILRLDGDLNSHEVSILDGNNEGKAYLFSDNTRFEAKPDIIVRKIGDVLAIGDVKYKTHLGEADRYQLISHALSYGADAAFFITPLNKLERMTDPYIGQIGDIKMYHYKLDLEADNLDECEQRFQNWVKCLALNADNNTVV